MSTVATTQKSTFDKARWKRINDALDQALELEGSDVTAFFDALHAEDAALASEVKRLFDRAHQAQTSTGVGTLPEIARGLTTQLATVFREPAQKVSQRAAPNLAQPATANAAQYVATPIAERGFDDLLHRALRAERATQKSKHYSGELCGAWRLQNVIGTGGMGEVWLAERADGLYEAKAAVKFLRADGDADRFEARFSQERALLARLNHPGIARLLDAGRQFGTPFLVLEYVDGTNLLDYVRAHAPTVESRLNLIRQIGEAIAYAHSQLVVHRDLKPSNVLVTPDGKVKLLDFGVAGLLANRDLHETTESPATRIAGRGMTPEYAAPEQITGEATGVASDVYSLGALAFHLLTGRRAHIPDKPGRAAFEHAIVHSDAARVSDAARKPLPESVSDNIPPPTDLTAMNADLDAIVASMMRRDATARYRTAGDALADLYRFAAHRPIAVRSQDRAYRSRLWLRRNWVPFALGTSLVIALAAGLGVSLWQADRARDEADRANKTADYLVELLGGADPDLHGGNWPSALDLIERAERDLGTKFKDEPSVEQKISLSVARTLRRLSRFQEALPIAERSHQLSRDLYGENAEQTRIVGALLADILYWIDRDDEASAMLPKVLEPRPAKPYPEWWREAFLLNVNIDSTKRSFADAYRGYDEYREIIRGHRYESWLEAESETDRAMTLMTDGRQRESLAIHNKYRDALANPPEHIAKRIALTNLNNGDMMRLYMGQFGGLEDAFKRNLIEWDRLAGRLNQHSIEAVGLVGLYYYNAERPTPALTNFQEKLARLQALKTRNPAQELSVRIDVLETQTKYFTRAAHETLGDAVAIERDIDTLQTLSARTRNRYLQRLGLVRVTFGDAAGLLKSVSALRPTRELGTERADIASLNWLASATLHAAQGNYVEACQATTFAADNLSQNNRVLVAAPLQLRRALFCMLSGSKETVAHLAAARAALPDTLPREHRLWKVLEHLERIARSKNDVEIAQSQRRLAADINIPAIAELHPALLGLTF